VFQIWSFSGAWGLVLGVSLRGGSKTEMRPAWEAGPVGIPRLVSSRIAAAEVRSWILREKPFRLVTSAATTLATILELTLGISRAIDFAG